MLFTRDPFSVISPLNPGTDKRTRITLFGTNINLLPGETMAVVSARAVTYFGAIYDLPVEYVGRVPGFNWLSNVVVRLPDDQTLNGNIWVSISVRGVGSNSVMVEISPL